jgi:hypothetical protein
MTPMRSGSLVENDGDRPGLSDLFRVYQNRYAIVAIFTSA